MSGSVEFVGTAVLPTPEQMERVGVTLQPVDGALMPTSPGRIDAEGRFTTMGHLPGRYLVSASQPTAGWILQSAMLGGRDVSLEAVTLESRDISGVVLTFSDRWTELSGAVVPTSTTTSGDADATVVVYPSDLQAWMRNGAPLRQVRAARTRSDGRYRISALPAGSYLIAALPSDVEIQLGNPAFFESLAPLSAPLALSHGEQRVLDVRMQTARNNSEDDGAAHDQRSGPWVPEVIEPQTQAQAPVRDVVAVAVGSGSISGVVTLDDEARTPVRRARVRLTGSAGTVSLLAATDDEGRFVFRDLPAVRYSIVAERAGFVTGYHGASRPGRGPGAPVAIAEGQHLADVSITMGLGAVITGRVVDEFGLPVEESQISLLEFRTVNGVRTLARAAGMFGFASTDDRGVYRVFGLPAGEYVVSVAGRSVGTELRRVTDAELDWATSASTQPVPPQGPVVGSAPFYYPGTADPLAAVPVRVNPGEERSGIDLVTGYVRTASVSGRLEMPDGAAPRTAQVFLLNDSSVAGSFMIPTAAVRLNADGTFVTATVPPGQYTLTARAAAAPPDGAPPGGRGAAPVMSLWAVRQLEIRGDDVTGVTVTLAPGMTISGRVVFDAEGTPTPADLRGYSVRVSQQSNTGGGVGVPTTPLEPDGTFVIEGVAPGTYRISVGMPTRTGSLPTWTVQRIMHEGHDVADSTFEVRPGADVAGLEAVLIDRVTEVSGTVTDRQGQPMTDYSVLLLPTDPSAWGSGSRRRRTPQRPDSTGRFRFIDLPAGEYYLAVLTEFEPDELSDTAFLESLVPSAIKFSLAEGERKVQSVTLAGG